MLSTRRAVARRAGERIVRASGTRGQRESRFAAARFRVAAAPATAHECPAMDTPAAPRFRIAVHRAMGCYVARVAELPGCVASGATEVEAVENARAAIRSWLRLAQALAGSRATVEVEIRP